MKSVLPFSINKNTVYAKASTLGSTLIYSISYTDKKEKKIFLIYEEIQNGAVAKSYMRKDFLIYEEMRK
jgi:hypothetical protein